METTYVRRSDWAGWNRWSPTRRGSAKHQGYPLPLAGFCYLACRCGLAPLLWRIGAAAFPGRRAIPRRTPPAPRWSLWIVVAPTLLAWTSGAAGATTQKRYYAHEAVEDRYGVIAPWYGGQNGQIDRRVRTAAEFLKRYPWVGPDKSVMAGPHYVFNARVDLDAKGAIQVLPARPRTPGPGRWPAGP